MRKKSVISFGIVIALVLSLFMSNVFADPYDMSVNTDGSIIGEYDAETKTFTVTGTGAIEDYSSSGSPFYAIRSEVEHLVIGEGITRIGNNAFYRGSNLQSISLPSTLESIGDYAFRQCSGLTSISSESLPNLDSIGQYAFNSFVGLESVDLDGLTEIGDYAFYGQASKTKDTLQNVSVSNIGTIGQYAFAGNLNMTTVDIKTIGTIDSYAFANGSSISTTSNLKNISIDGVTLLDSNAFKYNSAESVTINNVETLADSAFNYSKNLKEVTLNNVKVIGTRTSTNAFLDDTSVEKLTINEGTTTINCYLPETLKELYLPASLTEIYDSFNNLPILEVFEFKGENVLTNTKGTSSYYLFSKSNNLMGIEAEGQKTARVHANQQFMIDALTAIGYSVSVDGIASKDKYESYPSQNISELGDATAYDNPYTGVIDVVGTGTVSYYSKAYTKYNDISDYFGIKEINVGEGITQINTSSQTSSVFGNKLGKTTYGTPFDGVVINLPSTLTSIERSAFSGATIKSINIPDGVTKIGESAFSSATFKMGTLTFPSTVKTVDDSAFYKVTIDDLVLNDGLETIGDKAFQSSIIPNINIPSSVKTIGEMAFDGSAITALTIPTSIESIGRYAFRDCVNISDVVIEPANNSYMDTEKELFSGLSSSASNKTATVNASNIYMIDALEALGYSVTTQGSSVGDKYDSYPANMIKEIGSPNLSDVVAYYNEYSKVCDIFGTGDTKGLFATNNGMLGAFNQLETLNVNEGVTSIGYQIFLSSSKYASNLKTVNLPSTLRTIEGYAFSQTAITNLTLPEGLETIEGFAFSLSNLQEVTIPSTVKTIESHAFGNIDNLVVKNYSQVSQALEKSAFPDLSTLYLYSTNQSMLAQTVDMTDPTIIFLDKPATSGTLENGVTWVYDVESSTITFSGTGEVPKYELGYAPWYGAFIENGFPTTWVFEEGITAVDADTFYDPVGGSRVDGSGLSIWVSGGSSGSLGGILGGYFPGASIGDLGSYGGGSGGIGPGGEGGTGGGGDGSGGGEGGDGSGGGEGGDGSDGGSTGGDGDTSTDETPKDESTYIIVDAEPTMFKVTVPIKIDVSMDTEGQITTGSGYEVRNECAMGPVVIENIKVTTATNWKLSDFNADYANMKVSSRVIGLQINGVNVGTDGSVVMNDSLSSVIRNKESKSLTFDAKLSAQKTALNENVAAVVFTVDFDKV